MTRDVDMGVKYLKVSLELHGSEFVACNSSEGKIVVFVI